MEKKSNANHNEQLAHQFPHAITSSTGLRFARSYSQNEAHLAYYGCPNTANPNNSPKTTIEAPEGTVHEIPDYALDLKI